MKMEWHRRHVCVAISLEYMFLDETHQTAALKYFDAQLGPAIMIRTHRQAVSHAQDKDCMFHPDPLAPVVLSLVWLAQLILIACHPLLVWIVQDGVFTWLQAHLGPALPLRVRLEQLTMTTPRQLRVHRALRLAFLSLLAPLGLVMTSAACLVQQTMILCRIHRVCRALREHLLQCNHRAHVCHFAAVLEPLMMTATQALCVFLVQVRVRMFLLDLQDFVQPFSARTAPSIWIQIRQHLVQHAQAEGCLFPLALLGAALRLFAVLGPPIMIQIRRQRVLYVVLERLYQQDSLACVRRFVVLLVVRIMIAMLQRPALHVSQGILWTQVHLAPAQTLHVAMEQAMLTLMLPHRVLLVWPVSFLRWDRLVFVPSFRAPPVLQTTT